MENKENVEENLDVKKCGKGAKFENVGIQTFRRKNFKVTKG